MRKIIIGLLLLLSVGASAQWQQTGSKVRYVNGLGIPTKDTAAGVSADSSQIVIRPADSSLYVKYKRTWLRVGGGGGSIAGGGTTNYIPKFTSSTAIGNSQIYDNGTKVGVGTVTPGYKLTVGFSQASNTFEGFSISATTIAKNYAILSGNATGGGLFGLTNPFTGFINYTDAAATSYINDGSGYFSWHNSTTELMRLTNVGNVGIGTTSPAAKLSVQGTTLINTNTDNGVDKLQVSGSATVSTDATIKRYLDVGTSGTNNNSYLRTLDGSVINKVQSVGSLGAGYLGTESNHDVNFITNNTIRATITAAGAATFNSSVISTQYKLSALNTAPASATATGTLGEIRIDANYIYICTATNTWKRVAIATW